MKVCSKCKENKEISYFSKDKGAKDGFQHKCKLCAKAYDEISRAKNKETRSAYNAQYYVENKKKENTRSSLYKKENAALVNSATARRNAAKIQATPSWLTESDYNKIDEFYIEAARKTKETGIPHEVDHILPLLGKNVRGLHVPWNLQILTKSANSAKGNRIDASYL
jgi:5-methylcytosine-specific restriction endonuclease McrA